MSDDEVYKDRDTPSWGSTVGNIHHPIFGGSHTVGVVLTYRRFWHSTRRQFNSWAVSDITYWLFGLAKGMHENSEGSDIGDISHILNKLQHVIWFPL